MSNANRDYAIVYDIKNSSLALSRPLIFYITDKNTSNIFVKLVTKVSVGNEIDKYTDIENASNYILTMRVIKPNNEVKSIEATQHEKGSIFQFDLTEDFKDIPGKYICELTISTIVNSRQELITSDPFSYEVKRSILSNIGEIIETEDITVEKLLNDLEATKAEISSQAKDKVSKGEGGVITHAMLSQEVKEAITGGSVAVVGKNAILTENIVDGQVTKGKTSFYTKSINLENRDLFVEGKGILAKNGDLYDNSNLIATVDYIPINCNYISYEKFNSEGISVNGNDRIGIAFYDSNKSFVGYSSVSLKNYTEVPSNVKYMRTQLEKRFYDGYNINLLPMKEVAGVYMEQYQFEEMLEINKEIAQLKDGSSIQNKAIKPSKTTFFNVYKNLFNTNSVSVGAILKGNGILEASFDQWRATDWIEVKGGTTIYFSNDGEPYITHLGALYNTNKNYLSPINNVNSVEISQDGYMRVSQNGGFPDKFQIEVGKVTKYKEFGVEEVVLKQEYLGDIMNETGNGYEGKNYLLLGDSITALGNTTLGWEYYFRNIMKPNRVVNISVNGCTWKDKVDTPDYDGNPIPQTNLNVIGNQVQKVINQKTSGNTDYDDFDVIIIACGTNDSFDPTTETIDTVEGEFITSYNTSNFTVKPINTVDRKTFPGIMRYTYEKLYELYPNAVFFVTTPLQEVYETYSSIKAKGDFIDYIADRLSINTINARRCGILNTFESPVNDIDYDNPSGSESMRKRDLSDGIHTNESGGKKLGEFIARDIINYFNF